MRALRAIEASQTNMNIVITGHVDHGKSTVIGRLMADTGSLPLGKLEQVRQECERNSKPFEYAFLLDALKDERAQGITIDSARVFFKTDLRHYIIIDAPGHVEFLKNMVSGAARAEAALLVIDAKEGIQENSRRHGYILSLLGIKQIAVLVNKMDLVGYDQNTFERLVSEFQSFLAEIGVRPMTFIPVSGFHGDNIANASERMPWYRGGTVMQVLDGFRNQESAEHLPFRMPVQGVYKFTKDQDDRRIIAGTIESGTLRVGDPITFLPSGKSTRVKSIETFNEPSRLQAEAGRATGFTVTEQIYISRGELAVVSTEPAPQTALRFKASIFWLGREPLSGAKEYILKLGAQKVPVRIEKIERVIDAYTLAVAHERLQVERNEVAECVLSAAGPVVFDSTEAGTTLSRFVLVDGTFISGGGIIREKLADRELTALSAEGEYLVVLVPASDAGTLPAHCSVVARVEADENGPAEMFKQLEASCAMINSRGTRKKGSKANP